MLVNKSYPDAFTDLVRGTKVPPEKYQALFINEDLTTKYTVGIIDQIKPKLNETGWNRAIEIFDVMNHNETNIREELVANLLALVNESLGEKN